MLRRLSARAAKRSKSSKVTLPTSPQRCRLSGLLFSLRALDELDATWPRSTKLFTPSLSRSARPSRSSQSSSSSSPKLERQRPFLARRAICRTSQYGSASSATTVAPLSTNRQSHLLALICLRGISVRFLDETRELRLSPSRCSASCSQKTKSFVDGGGGGNTPRGQCPAAPLEARHANPDRATGRPALSLSLSFPSITSSSSRLSSRPSFPASSLLLSLISLPNSLPQQEHRIFSGCQAQQQGKSWKGERFEWMRIYA